VLRSAALDKAVQTIQPLGYNSLGALGSGMGGCFRWSQLALSARLVVGELGVEELLGALRWQAEGGERLGYLALG
jgi:hypothetical protein